MSRQCTKSDASILDRLYEVILERRNRGGESSYVATLFASGKGAVRAKLLEEAGELADASERGGRADIVHEAADLVFHLLVLLGQCGVSPGDIYGELARRWGTSGLEEKKNRQQKPLQA